MARRDINGADTLALRVPPWHPASTSGWQRQWRLRWRPQLQAEDPPPILFRARGLVERGCERACAAPDRRLRLRVPWLQRGKFEVVAVANACQTHPIPRLGSVATQFARSDPTYTAGGAEGVLDGASQPRGATGVGVTEAKPSFRCSFRNVTNPIGVVTVLSSPPATHAPMRARALPTGAPEKRQVGRATLGGPPPRGKSASASATHWTLDTAIAAARWWTCVGVGIPRRARRTLLAAHSPFPGTILRFFPGVGSHARPLRPVGSARRPAGPHREVSPRHPDAAPLAPQHQPPIPP